MKRNVLMELVILFALAATIILTVMLIIGIAQMYQPTKADTTGSSSVEAFAGAKVK